MAIPHGQRRPPHRLLPGLCLLWLALCVPAAGTTPQVSDGPQGPMSDVAVTGLPSPVAAGPVEDGPSAPTGATSDRQSGAPPQQKSLSMFFVVGIAINLLMGVVVGVWAYREWRS